MSLCRIARAAQGDLDEIWCHIGAFDVRAADHWLDGVERRFKVLAKQPQAGQARPDLAPELRFLPVGKYLILLPANREWCGDRTRDPRRARLWARLFLML